MKDNKKKILLITSIILFVVILIIVVLVFRKGNEPLEYHHTASKNIVTSLNVESQSEVDKLIKEDLEKNEYSLNNAKIYVDPYGVSPLSALVVFKTNTEASVKLTLKGQNANDVVTNFESSEYHYIPVYALYQDYENTIVIETSSKEEATLKIPIEKIENLPTISVNTKTDEILNDIYLLSSPIEMRSLGIDGTGQIRWLPTNSYYHDIHFLKNGHILIGGSQIADNSLATKIYEIDMLGRIYKEYEVVEGYLGNFFLKDDGNIIVASKKEGRDTYSDYILELDYETGKVVKTWDIIEILKTIDSSYGNNLDAGYFYNSGIEYDSSSDTLLLTYWGGECVLNIGYSDSSLRWIFSDEKNFPNSFSSVLLKGSEDFVYPKSMHSATLKGDTLKVFDNGYSTIKNDTTISHLKGSYSSANTYKLSGNSITLVSSIDESKSLFSYALADYDTANDSDLVLFGRELNQVNYDKDFDINEWSNLNSRLIEMKNSTKVFDMVIDMATQYVEKIELSGLPEFNFDLPRVFTSMKPAVKQPLNAEIKRQIKLADETVDYRFGCSKNIIEHNVLFMSADEADLILINDNEEGALYTLKSKTAKANKRILSDLAPGSYYVYVLENGKMYKTDSKVEIR